MTEATEAPVLPFDDLQVGDLVEHPQWGIGSILQRSGRGENAKLLVTFPELEGNGQKKLKAAFAKLKKIEDGKKREEEERAKAEAEAEEERQKKAEEEGAAEKAKAAAAESESESESDDDDEEEFDEEEAARALNIEDEEEEVAKADVKDDDWEEDKE